MAILNEIQIMGPNKWFMFLFVVFCVATTFMFLKFIKAEDVVSIIKYAIVMFILFTCAVIFGVAYDDPANYVPTGETQIEAVFPNGEIPSAYRKRYDVIEQIDNLYVLEER